MVLLFYHFPLACRFKAFKLQSSRNSLSVSIQAPLIVIPVSSTSHDALVANLGHLSVSNSFDLVHDGKDPSGSDAVVVDNMVVQLSAVQLSRLELNFNLKGERKVAFRCPSLKCLSRYRI